MRVIVLGGGFLGQLLLALYPEWEVFDWRPTAPTPEQETRAFGPQYLWQPPSINGRVVQARQFSVYTTIDGQRAATYPALVEAYKRKVGKEQDGSDWRTQFVHHMFGYEPVLSNERVTYNKRVTCIATSRHVVLHLADGSIERCDRLVSTIPLYALLPLLGMMDPGLHYRPIYCHVGEDLEPNPTPGQMYVNYVSSVANAIYRVTRRNGLVYSESLDPLLDSRKLLPGKIYPNGVADALQLELAERHIHLCGRFATWNPDELAHESIVQIARQSWT